MGYSPEFRIGDRVAAVAFTDCFGEHHAEVPGLTVTDVRRVDWHECGLDRSYYRYLAQGTAGQVEGAARYFRAEVA